MADAAAFDRSVTDLESTNGTFSNGTRLTVRTRKKFEVGHDTRLGDIVIQLGFAEAPK